MSAKIGNECFLVSETKDYNLVRTETYAALTTDLLRKINMLKVKVQKIVH